MAKAIFTTKVLPSYDDLPEERYHFPKTYLNQVSQAVGDWIVYYEPRRASSDVMSSGGRQAYFAVARLEQVTPDIQRSDHFFAEVSNYLEFSRPVRFVEGQHYYEAALRKTNGSTTKGAFGRAVRLLPDHEFAQIWRAGFGHLIGLASRNRPAPDVAEDPLMPLTAFGDSRSAYIAETSWEVPREIVKELVSRPFRDRAFSAAVKTAYSDTCAISGLKIINGGGRSEVQAAHIKPVSDLGPDSVRNGIALSGTVHWMFDRGLISVDDNHDILLAKDRIPDSAMRLLAENRKLRLPTRIDLHPHPAFLAYHRNTVFKG